jgi:hypothetical protein
MFNSSRFLGTLLVLAMPFLARAQAPVVERPLEPQELAPIQEATRELAREVEYLQEDIVSDLGAQTDRALYRQVDAALGNIYQLQVTLKPGVTRAEAFKQFDAVEQKLHELLKAVRALGPDQRLLKRTAARVAAADEALHQALAAREPSDLRLRQALEGQTRSLVMATGLLDKSAQYALGEAPGRGVLVADLRALAVATEAFQKSLTGGADRAQLESDFAAVNKAWERAIAGLQDLKPNENVHLLHAAARVEQLHESLFRLLGLKGERPRLSIRT